LIAPPETLTPTQAQPEIEPVPTIPLTSRYCCSYNQAGTGQTEIGFYIPPKNMGSTTILLPITSQYDPGTKVLGVSQQIFLPVKDASAISNWTDQRQSQICSEIDSAFQKLQVNKKLSKALHDKVADNTASNHQSSISERKDNELMCTMNSLFKEEGCTSIEGIYTLKFGEGTMGSGDVPGDEPTTHNAVLKIPLRGLTLTGSRAKRLPGTLKSDSYGPTETVEHFVLGTVDIWKTEV
jgi:hypothetical protein